MNNRLAVVRLLDSVIASGNTYKVYLLMAHLGLRIGKDVPLEELDILATPSHTTYFVDEALSLADFALYAYTHTAHLTGFDMNAVPNVVAWLDRVRSAPNHIPIKSGPGSELC